MTAALTRKNLYELVWSKTLNTIQEELNIDYHTLVKLCAEHNIPRPPSSYWSKLKFGKQTAQPQLPDPENDSIVWGAATEKNDPYSWMALSGKALEKHIQEEIENDPRLDLTVSKRLSKPDKLIQDYLRVKEERERLRKKGKYLSSYDHPTIAVHTSSEGQQARALRIMDCLIKNLRLRGHVFKLRNYHYEIDLYGESFPFSLREVNKRIQRADGWGSDYKPTGKLAFKIEMIWAKEWQDQKTVFLEDKIAAIIAKLEYIAKTERAESIYRKVKHRRDKVERERAEAIRRQEIAEDERFEKLLKLADQWKRVENLKEFLNWMETSQTLDETNKQTIKWAQDRIAQLDFPGSLE